jgi:hypothetical protein
MIIEFSKEITVLNEGNILWCLSLFVITIFVYNEWSNKVLQQTLILSGNVGNYFRRNNAVHLAILPCFSY